MKVIIVANQDEIGKSVTEKGRELQYLVASDGREIVFESKSKQDEILEYYNEWHIFISMFVPKLRIVF